MLTEGDSCFEYAISKISELTWTWPKFPLYSLGKQVNEIRRERPREANIDLDTTASRAAKFQIRFGTNGFFILSEFTGLFSFSPSGLSGILYIVSPVQSDATLFANNSQRCWMSRCVRLHTLLHVFACCWRCCVKFETHLCFLRRSFSIISQVRVPN